MMKSTRNQTTTTATIDNNTATKKIKRQKSLLYFWNNNKCETTAIDENLTEIGIKNRDNKQKNSYPISNNDELKSNNIFSRLFKKVNSVFSGQQQSNKSEQQKNIKHSRSMIDLQSNKSQERLATTQQNSHTKRRSLFTKRGSTMLLSSPPIKPMTELLENDDKNDKNELNDWKNTLLNELDATQYKINNYRMNIDNTDSNELIINTLQPSGMDNNKKVNQHFVAELDKKLGVISRKTMIDDWLHFNHNVIPDDSNSEEITIPSSSVQPSYLQHYHHSADNNSLFTKNTTTQQPASSLLSTQLKKQGKMKFDHVQEKLEIAAARRNAIKLNRLREQMDTALFETIHMLRDNHDNSNNNKQNLEEWLFGDKKIQANNDYYLIPNNNALEATSSLSNNDYCYLSTNNTTTTTIPTSSSSHHSILQQPIW